jgi:hypothetical protein
MNLAKCCVHCPKVSDAFSAENDAVRVLHLRYIPRLLLTEFSPFGHTKGALAGQQSTEPADFLDDIQVFLDEIQRSELEYVFRH